MSNRSNDNREDLGGQVAALVAEAGAVLKKVFRWAPAGEGCRRIALLLGLGGVILWTLALPVVACRPLPAQLVQAQVSLCTQYESAVDRTACMFGVQRQTCSQLGPIGVAVVIWALGTPLAFLFAWFSVQASLAMVFRTVRWVSTGFRS